MTLDRKALGARGEKAAAAALRRSGYRIIARNYTCPAGELDIVARKRGLIVFVEVKTRTSDAHAHPMENVTRTKRAHVARAAHYFLKHKKLENAEYRFDVIAIVWGQGRRPEKIEHIQAAFDESGL